MLGICVGMQVLFQESEESPGAPGLGWIAGKVIRLPDDVMIPQMGWNSLAILRRSEMLDGISDGDMFYFVHSYALEVTEATLARCDYGQPFSAVVGKDNFFGAQFHPERSGKLGAQLIRNFLEM